MTEAVLLFPVAVVLLFAARFGRWIVGVLVLWLSQTFGGGAHALLALVLLAACAALPSVAPLVVVGLALYAVALLRELSRSRPRTSKVASPLIYDFLCGWDVGPDWVARAQLKALRARVADAALSPEDLARERERWWAMRDWLIRTQVPAWLDAAGLRDQAGALRASPRIDSLPTLTAVQSLLSAATDAFVKSKSSNQKPYRKYEVIGPYSDALSHSAFNLFLMVSQGRAPPDLDATANYREFLGGCWHDAWLLLWDLLTGATKRVYEEAGSEALGKRSLAMVVRPLREGAFLLVDRLLAGDHAQEGAGRDVDH
jgi:hypothetical protein